jgi:hypothetical protein
MSTEEPGARRHAVVLVGKLLTAVLLGVVAAGLNRLAIPVFGQDSPQLLLGGSLVWAACEGLSPLHGLLVAVLSLGPLLARGDTAAYATAVYAAEYGVVWYLQRRVGAYGLTASGFWLVCGIPLDLLAYRWGVGLSSDYIALLWFKQILNATFNGLIVDLLVLALGPGFCRLRRGSVPVPEPGRAVLFRLVALVGLLPVLVGTGAFGRANSAAAVQRAYLLAGTSASSFSRSVDERLLAREVDLQLLSRQLDLAAPAGPLDTDAQLHRFLRQREDFVNVCLTDASGTVVASAPEVNADGGHLVGRTVATRAYFKRARDRGASSWAPLILGNLHVRNASDIEPILILASPLFERAGSFRGIVFVAIDPGVLLAPLHAARTPSPVTRTIVDQAGLVVGSDAAARRIGSELAGSDALVGVGSGRPAAHLP